MSLELTTLAARTDLIETVAGWFREEWPDYFSEHDAVAHLTAQAQTEMLPIALLVMSDGEPVGTVALAEQSIDSRPELGPWIVGLYVHPDHRKQGIAQLLVVSACRIGWSMGHEQVFAGTSTIGLFEAVGFEVVGETEQSGKPITLLAASKPAAPPNLYDEVGGESAVHALVDRFYDLMDTLPEATEVREMHARSLKRARQNLFEFLSGWLGGPQLYVEKHGHPRLRARHLPFSIGTNARDEWLLCMNRALEETVDDDTVRAQIANAMGSMADHMRNRPGE